MIKPSTWIEIDQFALNNNLVQYKKVIGNGFLAPVIKSNAYGHGQLLMAQLLEQNNLVDFLCISRLSEALYLRNNNISKPLLVLSDLDAELFYAAQLQISIAAYNTATLQAANIAGMQAKKQISVHLKIDTGMSRYGVPINQALDLIKQAYKFPYINVQGIFTHFAQSQMPNSALTQEQYLQFNTLLEQLDNLGFSIAYRHCANSAATTLLPSKLTNFYRIGIGIYGIWPSDETRILTQAKYPEFLLKPILTWKTLISDIRTIPAGTIIGYDSTFTTQRITQLALLPVGYYEGFDRRLSNCGKVIIQGKLCPVLGRVCMNVLMVDVTDCQEVASGNEVVLIGDYEGIRADQIATDCASFNAREILARLNPNLTRQVVNNAVSLRSSSYKKTIPSDNPITNAII